MATDKDRHTAYLDPATSANWLAWQEGPGGGVTFSGWVEGQVRKLKPSGPQQAWARQSAVDGKEVDKERSPAGRSRRRRQQAEKRAAELLSQRDPSGTRRARK